MLTQGRCQYWWNACFGVVLVCGRAGSSVLGAEKVWIGFCSSTILSRNAEAFMQLSFGHRHGRT